MVGAEKGNGMRKLVVVVVTVLALSVGTVSAAVAQEGPVHHEVAAAVSDVVAADSVVACGAALFFAGTAIVLAAITDGIAAIFSWFGVGYAVEEITRNKTCAADSYIHHAGYRNLCYNGNYLGSDIQGHVLLSTRNGLCLYDPITADGVYCRYLHGMDEQSCLYQFLFDLQYNAQFFGNLF